MKTIKLCIYVLRCPSTIFENVTVANKVARPNVHYEIELRKPTELNLWHIKVSGILYDECEIDSM